jgi:DNA polymerase I-like protein with 3'-5' exonuclease and polymerase domains/RecA-family ATPase
MSLDVETKDGGLLTDHGPGWPWHDGYIAGVSVAYRAEGTLHAHYFPIRHPDSQNFDPAQVFQWVRDHIAAGVRSVTQNGLYDWGWLYADAGISMPPSEQLEETQALATMVDENRHRYSLEALCAWRGLPGKDDALLREGCAALGLIPKGKKKFNPAPHIWQLPARYVGRYAEQDPTSTLLLFESLDPVLDRENTRGAYRLEVDLLPMVHAMRRRGIRIDTARAEQVHGIMLARRNAILAQLAEKHGSELSMTAIRSDKQLAKICDGYGIKYPLTEKGNASFKAGRMGWMDASDHWLPQFVASARRYDNSAKFVESIVDHARNGRVFGEIHPHHSDTGGTRTLRFSYSSPALQQTPKHNVELAPLIRSIFLPEEGETWASCDLSQQEFRLIVHYAVRHKLRGAAEMRDQYIRDPHTDIHAATAERSSGALDRQAGKSLNFGKFYGMGLRTFAHVISKPQNEAQKLYDLYDQIMPFVSQLSNMCKQAVWNTGHLSLLDCARMHFNQWAAGGKWKEGAGPCSRAEAEQRVRDPSHPWYGQKLYRADAHKALNTLIQGSAARLTKTWMREVWRAGVVPMLQMHDSLDLSVPSSEQAELVARLGEEAIKLEVPMVVDVKYGRTWADAKHAWNELGSETSPHADLTAELSDAGVQTQREAPKFSNDFDEASDSPPWEGDQNFEVPPAHDVDWSNKLEQDFPRVSAGAAAVEPPLSSPPPQDDDELIRTRLAEEGIPWDSPSPSPPPLGPSGGDGQGDGFSGLVDAGYSGNGAQRIVHSSDGNVHGDSGTKHGRCTARWFYPHLDRSNYLRVDRHDNGERKFYQHHWDGKRWVAGVKGTYAERKIPYRLSELKAALQADPNVEVHLCEGESDADKLAQFGFVTTTNPGGALSWTPDLTSWLRILGVRRAVIHEDNDGAAQKFKAQKRTALLTSELSGFIKLKVVRYPDVPEGEDVRWWLEHGHTKQDLEARIAAAPPAVFAFPFINMSAWDSEPVPVQQWTVPGRIPLRQSVIFSGEGGAGKSIIQLHLSAAAALGRDWLGATPEQGPALFIDCEDDQNVMHYRLAAIARHFGTCFADLIRGGLHLTSLVGQDTVMATVSRSGVVEPTPLYNRLLQAAGDIKPKIIGIAASANVFAGDENNRSQVQQFVNLTTRLAIAANGSLTLITHPSITGITSGSGLSGSTQWHNAVRARFFLRSPKTEPGEQPNTDLREIEFKKNQYGAMAENIPLRWQDGMFLPIEGMTFDQAEQAARADEVFLELLRRFNAENRYVSSSLGPTYAPAQFAKEDSARTANVNGPALAAAMRRLFAAGKVYNEQHGKASRPRFHLAIKL